MDKTTLIAPLVSAVQKLNTKVDNLKIGKVARSAEENWQDILIGLLGIGFIYQQFQIRKLRNTGNTYRSISKIYNICISNICSICLRHSWKNVP